MDTLSISVEQFRQQQFKKDFQHVVHVPLLELIRTHSSEEIRKFTQFYPRMFIIRNENDALQIDAMFMKHELAPVSIDYKNKFMGGIYSLLLTAKGIDNGELHGFSRIRFERYFDGLTTGLLLSTNRSGIARPLVIAADYIMSIPNNITNLKTEFIKCEIDNRNARDLAKHEPKEGVVYNEMLRQQEAWQNLFSQNMGYKSEIDGIFKIIFPKKVVQFSENSILIGRVNNQLLPYSLEILENSPSSIGWNERLIEFLNQII